MRHASGANVRLDAVAGARVRVRLVRDERRAQVGVVRAQLVRESGPPEWVVGRRRLLHFGDFGARYRRAFCKYAQLDVVYAVFDHHYGHFEPTLKRIYFLEKKTQHCQLKDSKKRFSISFYSNRK